MASTTFVNYQTVIDAAWLNDVNSAVYSGTFQASTITPTNITSSGAISGATVAGTTSVTTPIVKSGTSLTLQTNGSTTALTLDTSQNATFAGKVASASSLQLATNGTTTAITIDPNQNVGVGVTPSAWQTTRKALQFGAVGALAADSASTQYLNNAYFNTSGSLTYIANGLATYYQQYNGQHQWSTAASGTAGNAITFTQAMTLDASGNLLVGATSAVSGSQFRVYQASGANTEVVDFSNNAASYTGALQYNRISATTGSTSNYFFAGQANGTDNIYIYGNGNIVNRNNSYGTLSDIKLKENIVDTTPKLADIMRLQVRNFNLKENPENKQIGFIAQELEQVFPSIVDESPDRDVEGNILESTTKSIKTSVLIPILVKAIQELSAQVTTLQTQVTALQAKG